MFTSQLLCRGGKGGHALLDVGPGEEAVVMIFVPAFGKQELFGQGRCVVESSHAAPFTLSCFSVLATKVEDHYVIRVVSRLGVTGYFHFAQHMPRGFSGPIHFHHKVTVHQCLLGSTVWSLVKSFFIGSMSR